MFPPDRGNRLVVILYWSGSTDTGSSTIPSSLNTSWKLDSVYASSSPLNADSWSENQTLNTWMFMWYTRKYSYKETHLSEKSKILNLTLSVHICGASGAFAQLQTVKQKICEKHLFWDEMSDLL